MLVNLTEARARLSELIAAAERGEDVVICRRGRPAVRLVSIDALPIDALPNEALPIKAKAFFTGSLEGLLPSESIPDFTAPMSEEDLADWGA